MTQTPTKVTQTDEIMSQGQIETMSQNDSDTKGPKVTQTDGILTQRPIKVTQTDGILSHSQMETKSQNDSNYGDTKGCDNVSDSNGCYLGSLCNKEQPKVDNNSCDIGKNCEFRDNYYEGISNLFDSPIDWGIMEVKDTKRIKSNSVNTEDKSVVKMVKDKSKNEDVNIDKKTLKTTRQKFTLKDWIMNNPRTKVNTSVEAK